MKKRIWIWSAVVIVAVVILWLFFGGRDKSKDMVKVKVRKGDFKINVTTTGELDSKSSEKIYGPTALRTIGIWQVKISDIIPDGTVVDSGQYVATLDRTEIANKLKDLESELEKLQSQFTKTKLDTSLDLRSARDELINLKYSLEEKKLTLEQSKYEPPATIRQVEIDLEKTQRNYDQTLKNYKLRHEKAVANMQEVSASLDQAKRKYEQMSSVLDDFVIKAPKHGMVIYKRNWDGSKQGVGSTLSAWENVVATLPDLTQMISKTYVNEIDISKVKTGQKVDIVVDAFPDKKFTGEVVEVANIGEQMRSSNSKVFEVTVKVNEYDSILRPAMTTKNTIQTSTVKNVLYVPIECIHNSDSLTYVFTANGRIHKQQVRVGVSNENEIVILAGLKEGDEVFLNEPENADKISLTKL